MGWILMPEPPKTPEPPVRDDTPPAWRTDLEAHRVWALELLLDEARVGDPRAHALLREARRRALEEGRPAFFTAVAVVLGVVQRGPGWKWRRAALEKLDAFMAAHPPR